MDTLDLLRRVRFDKAFMFAYSMREKTHAHRSLSDDVDEPTKQRRLREVIALFNQGAREANQEQVGRVHLLLVDGPSKKSPTEWVGRTDCNRRASCDTAEMRPQIRPRCDLRHGRDAISDTAEMRSQIRPRCDRRPWWQHAASDVAGASSSRDGPSAQRSTRRPISANSSAAEISPRSISCPVTT